MEHSGLVPRFQSEKDHLERERSIAKSKVIGTGGKWAEWAEKRTRSHAEYDGRFHAFGVVTSTPMFLFLKGSELPSMAGSWEDAGEKASVGR